MVDKCGAQSFIIRFGDGPDTIWQRFNPPVQQLMVDEQRFQVVDLVIGGVLAMKAGHIDLVMHVVLVPLGHRVALVHHVAIFVACGFIPVIIIFVLVMPGAIPLAFVMIAVVMVVMLFALIGAFVMVVIMRRHIPAAAKAKAQHHNIRQETC